VKAGRALPLSQRPSGRQPAAACAERPSPVRSAGARADRRCRRVWALSFLKNGTRAGVIEKVKDQRIVMVRPPTERRRASQLG